MIQVAELNTQDVMQIVFEANKDSVTSMGLEWEYTQSYVDAITAAIKAGIDIEEVDRLTIKALRYDEERTTFEAIHDAILATMARGRISEEHFAILMRPFRTVFGC